MDPAPIITVDLQQLVIAVATALGAIAIAYNTYLTQGAMRAAKTAQEQTLVTQNEVKKVVLHTNSMKDELVKEVREAALAQGALNQRNQDTMSSTVPEGTSPVGIEEVPVKAKVRPRGRKT